MSNDMKTIMESWKKGIAELETSPEVTLPRIGQNRAKVAAEKEEEEKKKAQNKKDSAFAQAVLAAMGSTNGTVRPGTAQGREDVLDAVEGGYEKVEDFEDAMALLNMIPSVNIKKPEDIPKEVMPVIINLISTLSAVGMFKFLKAGAIKASLIQRFPYYKDTIINAFKKKAGMKALPFLLAPKLPPLELTMYGFLSAAAKLFADEFLIWFLGGATGVEFNRVRGN
jgi:hypothetical protein